MSRHNGDAKFLAMGVLTAPFRAAANALGLAWWARIDTREPNVTYWYGPYVRRSTLDEKLKGFLADLRSEAPAVLEYQVMRTRRGEPLTVEH